MSKLRPGPDEWPTAISAHTDELRRTRASEWRLALLLQRALRGRTDGEWRTRSEAALEAAGFPMARADDPPSRG